MTECVAGVIEDGQGSERAVGSGSDSRFVELQPGLCVALSSADSVNATSTTRRFPGDRDFIHFNCQLGGRFEARIRERSLQLATGELSMGFSDGEIFHIRHCREFSSAAVMVSPDLLHVLVGDYLPKAVHSQRLEFFVHQARPNRRVLLAGMRIAHAIQEEPCPRLLLHSATLDFLYWHLRVFDPDAGQVAVSARERKQLAVAKELLLSDLSSPPTIAELARKVGLNQCTLKRGFKAVFGSSLYAYFQAERMRHAKHLLPDNSVTETAVILGYSNVSHFSSAFRRHFGVLPSAARRTVVSMA
jgi:AraC family transcriptional regulator